MTELNDRAQKAPDANAQAASERLAHETLPTPPRTTDVEGRECKRQPGQNEIPTLQPGKESNGCDYQNFGAARPGNEQMPPFNTRELYDQAKGNTVRILTPFTDGHKTQDGQGSGVVAGKSDKECYVATVDHNVSTTKNVGLEVKGTPKVVMPNGKEYPAEVKLREPGNDRALLAVKTGMDTANVCNPAKFADQPEAGNGLTAGFPGDSKSLYGSPTEYTGIHKSKPQSNFPPVLTENKAHGMPGNSGGPMFTPSGKVYSLVEGPAGGGRKFNSTLRGTPITDTDVKNWMEQVR